LTWAENEPPFDASPSVRSAAAGSDPPVKLHSAEMLAVIAAEIPRLEWRNALSTEALATRSRRHLHTAKAQRFSSAEA
jgi:hypothetical protein